VAYGRPAGRRTRSTQRARRVIERGDTRRGGEPQGSVCILAAENDADLTSCLVGNSLARHSAPVGSLPTTRLWWLGSAPPQHRMHDAAPSRYRLPRTRGVVCCPMTMHPSHGLYVGQKDEGTGSRVPRQHGWTSVWACDTTTMLATVGATFRRRVKMRTPRSLQGIERIHVEVSKAHCAVRRASCVPYTLPSDRSSLAVALAMNRTPLKTARARIRAHASLKVLRVRSHLR
jgi:hypothetical protein